MNLDNKIYVAGHRGLVGSAIVRKLRAEGYSNIVVRTHRELDLTGQAAVNRFFHTEKPEYVFLAAARVGGILANDLYPADFIRDNLVIQNNVIDAAYKNGAAKLLFLGSSCIYPKMAPQPIKEEYLLTGPLEPTNEWYALAKIAGIKMCQSYRRQYGFNAISVMPTNLYGPHDNFNLETSHVLPALVRKFHLAKLAMNGDSAGIIKDEQRFGPIVEPFRTNLLFTAEAQSSQRVDSLNLQPATRNSQPGFTTENAESAEGTPTHPFTHSPIHRPLTHSPTHPLSDSLVSIWGTGTPRREFLHVDDLAEACVFLMRHYDSEEIINVGVGEDLTISELAEIVREAVGFDGDFSFDPSKQDGTPLKLLNVSRIQSLGWRARIGLPEGIRRVYDWYLKTVNSDQ